MRKLMKLLREKDLSLHKDMVSSSWTYHNNTTQTLCVCMLFCVLCIAQTKKGIDPTFYVFRWITLLLALKSSSCLVSPQGGPVCWSLCHWLHSSAEVIRIWDSLFADDKTI